METLKSNNKVVLRGKILVVEEPETVGEKGTKKQTVFFQKPPYINQFGDQQGSEEIWALTVMGKKVDELALTDKTHGMKNATVAFYVSSNEVKSKVDGKIMHIINTSLVEVQLYEGGK